jgi:hypothetical protein
LAPQARVTGRWGSQEGQHGAGNLVPLERDKICTALAIGRFFPVLTTVAVDLLSPHIYAHIIQRCKWKNKIVGTFSLDAQIMGVLYTNYEIHPQIERNAPARCGGRA